MDLAQELDFFRLLDGEVREFMTVTSEFGPLMSSMADIMGRAFEAELRYISFALRSPRSTDETVNEHLQTLTHEISEIQEFRDSHRGDREFFNHFATVAESFVALNWVRIPNTPVPFIREMMEAGDYFGNRVLSGNRGNQQHINWVNHWRLVMRGLENYVRQHFLTGLTFGIAVARPAAGGSPAVPPPPPPPPAAYMPPDLMAGGDNRAALLNELNQGVAITRMLRPVAPGAQRRRPGEGVPLGFRGDGSQPVRMPEAPRAPVPAAPLRAQPVQRVFPPKFILEGRKWRVEHQKNNLGLTVNPNEMSESLAMFKCENASLEVTDKMNGVTIDNCKRTTVVLKDIISSVELIRCDRVTLRCMGRVPTVTLDNCDSVQVFLSEEARGAEHILSKCTSTNICLMQPDGDYAELPVPEQIRAVVVDGRLQSSVVTIN